MDSRQTKLLLVHHFSLSSITGVTVMLAEMLRLVPSYNPDIEVFYQHYEGIADPDALIRDLDAKHSGVTCVVGVNLQIEVQWDLSLALAKWCAQCRIPLYNYVQDYWPHHEKDLRQLTDDEGVRLVAASPFLVESLQKDGFTTGYLPMGAQIPVVSPPQQLPRKVVAAIGRMVRRKRFPDVVQAFCQAGLDKTAELWLTLVPSQVFQKEQDVTQFRLIRNEMERPGVKSDSIHLIMTPTVPPDYSPYSVYVCASDYEGFSMTPFEAAYSGCPPIVSDIPPHRHMAESLFGEHAEDFLYPVTDTAALAERLQDELTTGRRHRFLEIHLSQIQRLVETRYSVRVTAEALALLCQQATSPSLAGTVNTTSFSLGRGKNV